jgi:hypothetical protein
VIARGEAHVQTSVKDGKIEGADGGTISKRLGISGAEVRTHVSVILNELGVNSRLQAAARYWRSGNDIGLSWSFVGCRARIVSYCSAGS